MFFIKYYIFIIKKMKNSLIFIINKTNIGNPLIKHKVLRQ